MIEIPDVVLTDEQQSAKRALLDLVRAGEPVGTLAGFAGCHAPGQGILMASGRVECIENVRVGDRVMGPDGPRTVIGTGTGSTRMYRITPVKGSSFIVTEDHVLCLIQSKAGGKRRHARVEATVAEYLKWSELERDGHKLYRVDPRKQAAKRIQVKNVLRTGISKIEDLGNGQYHGITVDGDHLYLMGDFTVTHNSGKTTLTKSVIAELRAMQIPFRLFAPTGRAAARLRDVTGEPAATIHSLYKRVTESRDGGPYFDDPREIEIPGLRFGQRSVVFIDEGSMVERDIYDMIGRQAPRHCTVLYFGDPGQLRPVRGRMGPDLDHPTAMLETVHRQALDNPILRFATDVRNGGALPHGSHGDAYERKRTDATSVAEWFADLRRAGSDAVLLCWSNEVRRRLNRLVRRALGRTQVFEVGDRVVGLSNNKNVGVMNGEILEIKSVDTISVADPIPEALATPPVYIRTTCGREFFAMPWVMDGGPAAFKHSLAKMFKLPPKRFLHVDHGESITIHRSQGSQFDTVGLVIDGALKHHATRHVDEARRLIYVGATRAKQTLRVFDLP